MLAWPCYSAKLLPHVMLPQMASWGLGLLSGRSSAPEDSESFPPLQAATVSLQAGDQHAGVGAVAGAGHTTGQRWRRLR